MSDSESSEEGHESGYYPDGSATYYQAQTPASPDAALAAGYRRPDAYAAYRFLAPMKRLRSERGRSQPAGTRCRDAR